MQFSGIKRWVDTCSSRVPPCKIARPPECPPTEKILATLLLIIPSRWSLYRNFDLISSTV